MSNRPRVGAPVLQLLVLLGAMVLLLAGAGFGVGLLELGLWFSMLVAGVIVRRHRARAREFGSL